MNKSTAYKLGQAFRRGLAFYLGATHNARMAMDAERWITVHPNGNGKNADYQRLLIDDDSGVIVGGMNFKYQGQTLKEAFSKEGNKKDLKGGKNDGKIRNNPEWETQTERKTMTNERPQINPKHKYTHHPVPVVESTKATVKFVHPATGKVIGVDPRLVTVVDNKIEGYNESLPKKTKEALLTPEDNSEKAKSDREGIKRQAEQQRARALAENERKRIEKEAEEQRRRDEFERTREERETRLKEQEKRAEKEKRLYAENRKSQVSSMNIPDGFSPLLYPRDIEDGGYSGVRISNPLYSFALEKGMSKKDAKEFQYITLNPEDVFIKDGKVQAVKPSVIEKYRFRIVT